MQVTADDQRRWECIVRDWNPNSTGALDQINAAIRNEFPGDWKQPYKDFVYGFTGMKPAQDMMGVAGQWVAARTEPQLFLYASVPHGHSGPYNTGDMFDINPLFPKEKLFRPEGFAELWAQVRLGQATIIRMMDEA